MPRIALVVLCVLVGACRFDADYSGGTYLCPDGRCPADLICRTDLETPICAKEPQDAAIDTLDDVQMDAPDGMMAALDCGQPGILTDGQQVIGTTEGRENLMQSFCNGGNQFAPDAVYRITTSGPNKQLVVTITGGLSAYVLNACLPKPNTPACLGGTAASQNIQITVAAAMMGNYFVVVDSLGTLVKGPYTLRVDEN